MTCNQYHISPARRAIFCAIILHILILFLLFFTILQQSYKPELTVPEKREEAKVIIQSKPSASSNTTLAPSNQTSPAPVIQSPSQKAPNAGLAPATQSPPPEPIIPTSKPVFEETVTPQPREETETISEKPVEIPLDQPPINPATDSAPVISDEAAGLAQQNYSPQYSGHSSASRARQAIRKARNNMYAPARQTNAQHTYETFIPPNSENANTHGPQGRQGGSQLTQEQLTHALNQDFEQQVINKYKSFVMYALCYELNKQNIHATPQETQFTIVAHITVACNGTITNVRIEGAQNAFTAQVAHGIYAASPVREIPPTVAKEPVTFVFTIRPNSSMMGKPSHSGPINFFVDDPYAKR